MSSKKRKEENGNKNEKYEIEVELSAHCNLNCPNCLVAKRMRIPAIEQRLDPNLVDKIIRYVPLNSKLYITGLGEPLLPKIQKKIILILKRRSDLTAYIQSNGTIPLVIDLIKFIENKRLEIGVSMDEHHATSGQKIRIQKKCVHAFSMAVADGKRMLNFDFEDFNRSYPNCKRIVIDPFCARDGKIISSWGDVKKVASNFAKNLPNTSIFVQIFASWINYGKSNREYYNAAIKNLKKINEEWAIHKDRFYVNISDEKNSIRILTDGRLLLGTFQKDGKMISNCIRASLPWKELEKKALPGQLIPLTEYYEQIK